MAEEEDTSVADWLNDIGEGFLPRIEDSEAQVVPGVPGIGALVASPRRLLAMKVVGARVDQNRDDTLTLCTEANVSRVEGVLDTTDRILSDLLTAKSRSLTIAPLQDSLRLA